VPREEEKPPEQIPWAERIKVTHLSDVSAWFENTWRRHDQEYRTTAECYRLDFEWSVSHDSRGEIHNWMKLDLALTKSIREFWEKDQEEHYGDSYRDRILRWLRGGTGPKKVRRGPKEWRPQTKSLKRRIGRIVEDYGYGYGNTYNDDPYHWWGDVFEYAHFKVQDEDGDDGEEGAIILWNKGGSPVGGYSLPEVYTGDFEEFMSMQSEGEPASYETFLHWNRNFENAFMWAWEKLGVFRDWDASVQRPLDERVSGVLEAIEHDPSILLPESVEHILRNGLESYPKQIRNGVTWLLANKRRELERALGQTLIWEDLYKK
jgi:hypothetical protein